MDPKGRTASCAGGCRGELGLLVHHVIIAERPHGRLGDVVWGMRDPTTALLLGSVAALGAPQQRAAPPASASPAPDGGQWTMPAKDYAATRYSALTDITAANVKRLRAVWTFSSGVLGGHEGQPLVVNHTMYAVTPYPNVLYAFDLTREGYPLKWKYRPYVNPAAIGIACCDVINRGAFYADGKIVYNLLDGQHVAFDQATGKELWRTRVADVNQGESTPMAPLVVKRSEEHTSELQSHSDLVCRLLLEKKKKRI